MQKWLKDIGVTVGTTPEYVCARTRRVNAPTMRQPGAGRRGLPPFPSECKESALRGAKNRKTFFQSVLDCVYHGSYAFDCFEVLTILLPGETISGFYHECFTA